MKIALSLAFASALSAQTLPDGPGKAITERMCKPCHGFENVVRARMTKDRWSAVVDDMVARGASGSDDEIDQVVDYLGANFGAKKVNVNHAGAADLVSALGISAADAARIVSYRTDKGKFRDLPDVTKVPGIDAKKITTLRDSIEF